MSSHSHKKLGCKSYCEINTTKNLSYLYENLQLFYKLVKIELWFKFSRISQQCLRRNFNAFDIYINRLCVSWCDPAL